MLYEKDTFDELARMHYRNHTDAHGASFISKSLHERPLLFSSFKSLIIIFQYDQHTILSKNITQQ